MSDISDIAIKRGNLYGAIKDHSVIVNHGSPKGYPDGDSVLWKLGSEDLGDMIALLVAIKAHMHK
ncbi:hypothetical protein MYO4S_00249 [Serratia phage 4S]|nr:hypothetical protein MYO4S_00249 [Serratia phage 4S]